DRSAVETTVVVAVAELLPVLGSEVTADTLAVFVSVPLVDGETLTTMLIVALAFPGKIPRLHVTVVVPEQDPLLGVADTNVTPAGSVSVTLTPLVVEGPAAVPVLVTVRRYVRLRPWNAGSGESTLVMDMSAGP